MSSDIRRSGDAPVKTVMLMVDGFGVPEEGWRGSVFERYCVPGFVEIFEEFSIPVDPGMGVPGIPQSATGQTALFTGRTRRASWARISRDSRGPPSATS